MTSIFSPVASRISGRGDWDVREVSLGHALLLIAFLGLAFLVFGGSFGRHQYDDAYITYRYAANLAEGKGYAFNPGERWNAASSPLYTGLLALCYRLGFTDLELAGSLIGLVSGCFVLTSAWTLALRWMKRPWLGWMCLLAAALNGQMAAWAVNGMEEVLFSAFIMAALLRLDQGASVRELALWLALATLCRLEGLALAPALAFGVWRRDGRWIGFWGLLILGLAPLGAWFLFCHAYFGQMLPHSLSFKFYCRYYRWSPAILDKSLRWMRGAQMLPLLGLLLGLAGAVLHQGPKQAAWFALLICSFLGLVEVLLGPYSDYFRYAMFLLPLTLLAAAALLDFLWDRRGRWGAAVSVGLLLILAGQSWDSEQFHKVVFESSAAGQVGAEEVGNWLDQNAAEGDLVLSVNLGMIAWRARRLGFIDGSGLCTPPVLDLVRAGNMDLMAAVARLRPRFVADAYDAAGAVPLSVLAQPAGFFVYPAGSHMRLPRPKVRLCGVAYIKDGRCILEMDWNPLDQR